MPAETAMSRLGPAFFLSMLWLAAVVFAAATADFWDIPAYDAMDWDHLSAFPGTPVSPAFGGKGAVHLLGTDTMGRDIVSRLVHGARISIMVSLLAPLIGFVLGGLLGCMAGYYRGRTESAIVATMDIILAFPGLVLLLVITFYLGANLKNLIFTLGFLTIPAFSRVARAKTLVLSDLEFIQAARLTGAGNWTILFREITPNVIIPLAIYGLLVAAFMIMAEGTLSFLGLGVPAPTPSWGGMIAEGREVLDEAPHVSMIPAAIMFMTVLAFNIAGDSLRHAFERGSSQL
jgi:peptide/nickel transport system permease protein